MPKPENVKYLILHITAGPWGSVESICRFHMEERGWADIGYAYLITSCYTTYEEYAEHRPNLEADGEICKGRDLDHDGDVDEEVGAHAFGYNSKSIGIAMVGQNGIFTSKQIESALTLCSDLMDTYDVPVEKVIGHYETGNTTKSCPQLAMGFFRELLRDRIN